MQFVKDESEKRDLQLGTFYIEFESLVSSSQARVHILLNPAYVALDLATPLEGAAAPLDHNHLLGLVSAAAAHQVAPVQPDRALVAHPAGGAEDTQSRVLVAELRRRLRVDQVQRAGRLVLRVVR